MSSLGRWILPMALVLVGWLVTAGPVAAQKGGKTTPPRKVEDTADLFSPGARQSANAAVVVAVRRMFRRSIEFSSLGGSGKNPIGPSSS